MKIRTALTLIEIVIVMGLVAIIGTTSILAFNNFRQKQALTASAQEMANTFQRAHIYAREEKNETAWAVKRINSTQYALLSGTKSKNVQIEVHQTEDPAYVVNNDYELWFNRAMGNTGSNLKIEITTPKGFNKYVEVNENGVARIY
jgi:type II secretory pathway pseudopilin PulG